MTLEERVAEVVGHYVGEMDADGLRRLGEDVLTAIRESVAEEREECARLADYEADDDSGFDSADAVLCKSIAENIRARGA